MLKVRFKLYLQLFAFAAFVCITTFLYSQIPLKFIKEHNKALISTIFSPDSKNIACLTADKTIKIYSSLTGELIKTLDDKGEGDVCISFSSDSKYLVSGCWDKSVKIWDVEKGKLLRRLIGHAQATRSVCYNADGKFIASAGWDDVIKIWYAPTGVNIRNFKGHTQCIRTIAFSPDGMYIASGGYDLELKVWNLLEGNMIFSKKAADFPIETLSYSPDGKYIATASLENVIKIWNAADGTLVKVLKGHTDAVYSVAFSPDGKYLVSGGGDNIVKIWKVEQGISIFNLKGHSLGIRTVSFSHDGKLIVSGAIDKTMRVWDASFLGIIPLQNQQKFLSYAKNENIISWEQPVTNPAISFSRHVTVVAQINDKTFKNIHFFLNKTEYTKFVNNIAEIVKPMSVKVTQDYGTEVSYDVYLDYTENEIQLYAESADHKSYVFSKPLNIKYFDLSEQLYNTDLRNLVISPEWYNDKKLNSGFEKDNAEKYIGIMQMQEDKIYNSVSSWDNKIDLSKNDILKISDSLALISKKQDVYIIFISGLFVRNAENKSFFVAPDANFKHIDTSLVDIENFCNSLNKTPAFGGLIINLSHTLQRYPNGFSPVDDNEIYNLISKNLANKKDCVIMVITSTKHIQIFDLLANSLHPLNDIDKNNIIDFEEVNFFIKQLYKIHYQYKGRYLPLFFHNISY